MTLVLCAQKTGMSFLVATKISIALGCKLATPAEEPTLDGCTIFVLANTGDEELQPAMERFFLDLEITGQKYAICELGNYFGYERDCFGCKAIARKLLARLGWEEISHVSVDALPVLDELVLENWIGELNGIVQNMVD